MTLATVDETRNQERAAGATTTDPATIKGKIVEFAWWMKKDEGYADKTIKNRTMMLSRLVKLGANLYEPETVKKIIAEPPVNWTEAYKQLFIDTYTCFLQMENLTWKPPKIKRPDTAAFIPTETELDQLINAAGRILGAFLQGLKDTGADPGELNAIKWVDVDKDRSTVRINHPVKGHNARILPVSDDFIQRLGALPKKGERVFRPMYHCTIQQLRKRLAFTLGNPRFLNITFKSFRHWKGTMEYHRTKDVYYVKDLLGHKKLSSTQVYIHYERAIYGSLSNKDEFTVRVATNVEEASAFVETGFEYVTGEYNDGGKIFRKRK
jgi:integrase